MSGERRAGGPAGLGRRGRFLVPLSESRATGWLFARLFVPHGRWERLLRRSARLCTAAPGSWETLAFPRRGSAADLARDDVAAAEAVAAAGWLLDGAGRALLGDAGLPTPLLPLIVTDYAGEARRRTLVFLFPAGADRPAAVAKLRLAETVGEPLVREAEALRRLRAKVPPALAPTLPRVLSHGEAAGREGLLLAALPGRSMWIDLHVGRTSPRRAAVHLGAALGWLLAFQAATRRDEAWRAPVWDELATGEPEPPWFRRLAERLARAPLPLVAGHGDFWPRNVLLAGGAVSAVVDWEAARPAAAPFDDFFTFVWSYALALHGRGGRPLPPERAFRRAFLDDTPISRAIARPLARHRDTWGVDGETFRDLFRLWLLARAAGDQEGGTAWRTSERMLGRAGRSAFSG